MLKKLIPAGIAAAIIVFVVLVMTVSANAINSLTNDEFRYFPINSPEIMQTIENKDYKAWYALMTQNNEKPKILEYINENNFNKYCEMISYLEKAKEISKELGIENGFIGGERFSKDKFMGGRLFQNSDVIKAVENKDYNAWIAAMTANSKNPKILETINATNFPRFCEMFSLMKDGNFEDAKKIAKELGLPEGRHMPGSGFGRCRGKALQNNN